MPVQRVISDFIGSFACCQTTSIPDTSDPRTGVPHEARPPTGGQGMVSSSSGHRAVQMRRRAPSLSH